MSAAVVIHSARPEPLLTHLSPLHLARLLARHRGLIVQFAQREIVERHRGAALGIVWNILNPLLSLAVFTFIFGVVMGVSWPPIPNPTPVAFPAHANPAPPPPLPALPFVVILFCGQTIFHVFAESANRAPTLITSRRGFVRKVVFPIEILSVAAVGSTVVYLAVGIVLTLAAAVICTGHVSTTAWMFPIVLVPLYLLSLGVSWFLSSLGVFLHDIRQIVGVVTSLLMFCSGVFYPIDRIPENMRWLVSYNPLYVLVESGRRTLLWSQEPDWPALLVLTAASLIVMQCGYAFFAKSKRGMADVV